MKGELVVLLSGRTIGVVGCDSRGRLTFIYDASWRSARGAYPLSLSMPLAGAEHGHQKIEAFIWGLLPDNERVLDRWARQFQVSARNPWALIAHVGEDCAGAVQFVMLNRLEALKPADPSQVEWLDEAGVAARLRLLRMDQAAWRTPRDTGQFSLAGAQPKTALLFQDGRWGVPSGRMPTTHILKPPTGEFDGHAENEHICLSLAHRMGLIAARSSVQRFEDEVAIVVERYDRVRRGGEILRVHQEDMCQALAMLPFSKYENEGGPSARTIVELIRSVSARAQEDEKRFIDALIFNWLIAGTDAHAKNYSLLIGAGGRARLAPLYDVSSALPYKSLDFQKLKLAMKVGGEYRVRDIGIRQWHRVASELKIEPAQIESRVLALASMLPDHAADVGRRVADDGLSHPLIGTLIDAIVKRAQLCERGFRNISG